MQSRLEGVIAGLQQLTTLELEAIKGIVQGQLNAATPNINSKYFEALPAELRDRIYFFVACQHLEDLKSQHSGYLTKCGELLDVIRGIVPAPALLFVNKQVRTDFMEVLYSNKLVTLYCFPNEYTGP